MKQHSWSVFVNVMMVLLLLPKLTQTQHSSYLCVYFTARFSLTSTDGKFKLHIWTDSVDFMQRHEQRGVTQTRTEDPVSPYYEVHTPFSNQLECLLFFHIFCLLAVRQVEMVWKVLDGKVKQLVNGHTGQQFC